MKNTLVFSVALNGYQFLYRRFLKSHKRYAKQINADHVVINSPTFVKLGTECCWLKIPLLLAAFKKGYSNVLFIDADALVMPNAPDIRDEMDINSCLHMAKGRSGRWNSGVIFAKNHKDTIRFFNEVMQRCEEKLCVKDSVGWGENGHIIRADNKLNIICELPRVWNNTFDPSLLDYIRHINAGTKDRSIFYRLIHNSLHWMTKNILGVAPESAFNTEALDNIFKEITASKADFFCHIPILEKH